MKKPYNEAISKQHKIRNVDKQVCTVEQMLVYNFAWSWKETIKRWYAKCKTEINKDEVETHFTKMCVDTFREYNKNYNLDAIAHIFRYNIRKYVENGTSGIAWSYEEVGRMFPCGYEIR
jgi:hypothetical protein